MPATLRSLWLSSTVRLLQEGAPQLAHRHPSVELRGAVPTQQGGRVLVTLPGGGRGKGKGVRMQVCGVRTNLTQISF